MNITQRIKFGLVIVTLIAAAASANHAHANSRHDGVGIDVTLLHHQSGININHSNTDQKNLSVHQHNLPSG
jgi:hypothetical protein